MKKAVTWRSEIKLTRSCLRVMTALQVTSPDPVLSSTPNTRTRSGRRWDCPEGQGMAGVRGPQAPQLHHVVHQGGHETISSCLCSLQKNQQGHMCWEVCISCWYECLLIFFRYITILIFGKTQWNMTLFASNLAKWKRMAHMITFHFQQAVAINCIGQNFPMRMK